MWFGGFRGRGAVHSADCEPTPPDAQLADLRARLRRRAARQRMLIWLATAAALVAIVLAVVRALYLDPSGPNPGGWR
jgi:hypothetical protein